MSGAVASKPIISDTGNAADSTGDQSVGGISPTQILLSPGFNAMKRIHIRGRTYIVHYGEYMGNYIRS